MLFFGPPKKNLEMVVKEYYQHEPKENFWAYCGIDINQIGRDLDTGYFLHKRVWEEVQKLLKKGVMKEEDTLRFDGWEKTKLRFYIPTQEEFESSLKQSFEIDSIEYGEGFFADRVPLYILKKL